jgi:hypothetical protein
MSDDDVQRDELVSAYVDGEATADEVSRVEGDPALVARVEQFRRIAADVAAVELSPPVQRDASIAAALDATPEPAATAPPDDVVAPIALDDEGVRRRRRRTVAVLSAAAVVLLLAIGGAVLSSVRTNDRQSANVASAPTASDEERDATPNTDEAAAVGAANETSTPGVPPVSDTTGAGGEEVAVIAIGDHPTRDDLAVAVTAAIDEYLRDESGYDDRAGNPPFAPSASARLAPGTPELDCAGEISGNDDELEGLLWVGAGRLDGQRLLIFLYETRTDGAANGILRLYTVAAASCEPIDHGIQTFTPG